MENFFQILILSLVQGVTEFLPVSSSAHIYLISNMFTLIKEELMLNVSVHTGSLLAVLFFFKNEVLDFGKNKKLFFRIVIASIPLFFFGYIIVKYNLLSDIRTYKIIGWMTIIFGLLLYLSDKFDLNQKIEDNFNLKSALFLGFFQVLALIPGVSRSGIIITGARFLKFNRGDAAKISFLMSIPALAGATVYGIYTLVMEDNLYLNMSSILTVCISFIFSYLTIKYFLIYLKKFSFNLIIFYRLILGLVILSIVYL
tara:strand:+ start:737 stop:1504 length:768 start_codon:yes stop_codon:yes gene_type:complete